MFFEQSNIDNFLGRARFRKKFPDLVKSTEEDWSGWYAVGNNALSLLNAALANKSFLVADNYSAADIAIFAYVHTADEGGFDLSDYPYVQTWITRVYSTPGFIAQMTGDYP